MDERLEVSNHLFFYLNLFSHLWVCFHFQEIWKRKLSCHHKS